MENLTEFLFVVVTKFDESNSPDLHRNKVLEICSQLIKVGQDFTVTQGDKEGNLRVEESEIIDEAFITYIENHE